MQLTEKRHNLLYNSSHKIDTSKFNPKSDTTHWHLSRALRHIMSPQGNISIIQDDNSGMATITYNGKALMIADSDSIGGELRLDTPFYGKNKVVFFNNQEIFLYYIKNIIGNYLCFRSLIQENNIYEKFSNQINDEFSFFENIVNEDNGFLNLDFPFLINFFQNKVLIIGDNEMFEIKDDSEHIKFKFESKYYNLESINLSKFLKNINKAMYNEYVFKKINVESKHFNIEHKNILKILEV